MVESEEELKSLFMKVKEESEKVDLTLNTYHDAAKKIERNSKKKKEKNLSLKSQSEVLVKMQISGPVTSNFDSLVPSPLPMTSRLVTG